MEKATSRKSNINILEEGGPDQLKTGDEGGEEWPETTTLITKKQSGPNVFIPTVRQSDGDPNFGWGPSEFGVTRTSGGGNMANSATDK